MLDMFPVIVKIDHVAMHFWVIRQSSICLDCNIGAWSDDFNDRNWKFSLKQFEENQTMDMNAIVESWI